METIMIFGGSYKNLHAQASPMILTSRTSTEFQEMRGLLVRR